MPRGRIPELAKRDKVPYERWAKEGLIIPSDGSVIDPDTGKRSDRIGSVIDYEQIKAKLREAAEMFGLQEVCYDPWNANDFATSLVNEGFRFVKIAQSISNLTFPMKKFQELVLSGRLRHAGHEVLKWNIDCLRTRTDSNGNIAPKKPDRATDRKRIDGAAALITAGARAFLPSMISSYENGVREIG